MLDLTSDFGKHVAHRLENETVAWLTTTGRNLVPQPRPIWFYWNGETMLIYTDPSGAKVRHIRQYPDVALHFNTNVQGRDVVVIHGKATLPDSISDEVHAGYNEKYGEMLKQAGISVDKRQHAPGGSIVITPTSVRGF